MSRLSPVTRFYLALAAVALPAIVSAQAFTTQKWNIGGDGFFDYLSTDPGTGHVFVSRGTHIMVVDGATGRVVGDIPNTMGPRSPRRTTTGSLPTAVTRPRRCST